MFEWGLEQSWFWGSNSKRAKSNDAGIILIYIILSFLEMWISGCNMHTFGLQGVSIEAMCYPIDPLEDDPKLLVSLRNQYRVKP